MSTWLDDAVFYEIYPQSFNDTNDDGIGDLQGIIEKLDYVRELGANALWLNPCFASPFGDAGYDVADYCRVAPRYGSNEDLERLFAEAHARDMHVLLDLVPGHTSIEHPWFKESCRAEPNEFSGRYVWTDDVWTPVGDVPGVNGVLRGIAERNGAVAVNFFAFQPALNYGFYRVTEPWQSAMDSPEALATRQAMKDVMAFWLDRGCDGFRVDMAGSLVKDDPEQEGTIALWQDMRAFLDAHYPNAVLISPSGASRTRPSARASTWTSCSSLAPRTIWTSSAASTRGSRVRARATRASSWPRTAATWSSRTARASCASRPATTTWTACASSWTRRR